MSTPKSFFLVSEAEIISLGLACFKEVHVHVTLDVSGFHPAFIQMLNNFSAILDKAEAHARNRQIEPEVLLNYRLPPDMLPFVRQIQIAAHLAKGAAARLAGVEVPKHDDTKKTFADLKVRLLKTVTFVQSFKPNDIDGSEDRDINLTLGEHTMSFKGEPYLVHFVMPNFYFQPLTTFCGIVAVNWASAISSELFDRECGRADLPVSLSRLRQVIRAHRNHCRARGSEVKCPKCNSKKVTQVPGRVYVVTSKKS